MNRARQRQLDQRPEFLYGSIIRFVLQSEGIFTSEFAKLPKISRTTYVACCGLIGLAVIIDLWVLLFVEMNIPMCSVSHGASLSVIIFRVPL
jgi:hypothetical protein